MAIEREVKKQGGVEGVERVLDHLSDAMDDAADVLEAGNRKFGAVADMDEDELLDELEQLELLEEMCTMSVPDEKRATQARPTPAPVPTISPAQLAGALRRSANWPS